MTQVFDTIIRAFCWSVIIFTFGLFFMRCESSARDLRDDLDASSSQDVFDPPSAVFDDGGTTPILEMPMLTPYASMCTQGVNGVSSHTSVSTRYDIDLDTSNTAQEALYAPIGGVAYVHTEDKKKNFGFHVSIDLGNGSYVILGHLSAIAVKDGQTVASGELIGYEGCTGYCSGDHVHIGVHAGDPKKMGQFGTSIPARYRLIDKTAHGSEVILDAKQMICGIRALGDKQNGHTYISLLVRVNASASSVRASSSQQASTPSSSSSPPQPSTPPKADPPKSTPNPTPSETSEDAWVDDLGLDGGAETLLMNSARWLSYKSVDQDAYVWGTGGCFDAVLTEQDRVVAKDGFYRLTFSKYKPACVGDLTLISSIGSDGLPPNAAMTNWVWWQNIAFCSKGSKLCELKPNGNAWEEWMLRIKWNPEDGLLPFGNGFTKNSQLK